MKKRNYLLKQLLTLITTFVIIVNSGMQASAMDDVTVVINGDIVHFDVPAQIIDGRTMVPMRTILQKLGAEVSWDGEKQQILTVADGAVIGLHIGDVNYWRNGVLQTMDVPPQIINGRTLVPIRIVSECLGADVLWKSETRTVYITSGDKIKYIDWNDYTYYYGEATNNQANGYGVLYDKETDIPVRMGYFENDIIIEGYDERDNTTFVGTFKDKEWYEGWLYYSNGDSYQGKFADFRPGGYGTYYFTDGSYYDGYWIQGKITGLATFYDAQENKSYYGSFTNSEFDGPYDVTDHNSGFEYKVYYEHGTLANTILY